MQTKDGFSIGLRAGSEIAFFVPGDEGRTPASIKLVPTGGDPRVDWNGSPLILDVFYDLLPNTQYNIYAWTNAKLSIQGSQKLVRSIFRSPSHSISRPLVEYHCYLHTKRSQALKSGGKGPVVLVCGKGASVKRNIGISLCNYALRSNWRPLLVDMNCGCEQLFSIPGCVSAGIIEYPITPDQVVSETVLSQSYFTGSVYPMENDLKGDLRVCGAYAHYCKLLAETVNKRLLEQSSNLYGASGAIVILPELTGTAGVNFISDLVYQLGSNHVLCFNDDSVFNRLFLRHEVLDKSGVIVDKLSQSFSAPLDSHPEEALPYLFDTYFNGKSHTTLTPSRWSKPFISLEVLSLRESNEQIKLVKLEYDELESVVGCVGALFYKDEIVSLVQATPVCFVRVQAIETTGVTFLTTTHHTFQSEKMALVVGQLRWITS